MLYHIDVRGRVSMRRLKEWFKLKRDPQLIQIGAGERPDPPVFLEGDDREGRQNRREDRRLLFDEL